MSDKWEIRGKTLISIRENGFSVLAQITGPYNGKLPITADTLRKIESLPELLEVCEWMAKYGSHQWTPGADNEPRFMDLVRAAIAKARGAA